MFRPLTLILFLLACYQSVSSATISYTLWFGDDIDREATIDLEVADGSTFLEAMELAASVDATFSFSSSGNPDFGVFIDEIAGVPNDFENDFYWYIYSLSARPDQNDPPESDELTNTSVDAVIVEDGGNYLFWFRSVLPLH